jgi:asparagine synthase (glutamine-hydrolysing)
MVLRNRRRCSEDIDPAISGEDPMCGICGKLNFDRDKEVSQPLLKAMADSIVHRGPDDEGYYFAGQVGLGFRRLSIIDLAGGHQPLSNEDGTVWIVFNGEIYNYQDLREDLLKNGHVFRTKSDTETIVHLYEEYGEAGIQSLRGMFAFAIWDQNQQKLLLARDRLGIKPLYYGVTSQSLVFASEMKAILVDPQIKREILPSTIDRFLTFGYVPGDETLLKGIHKLPPGSYMVVKNGKTEVKQYWDLHFSSSSVTLKDAEEQLLEILEESVRLHMIADVPVGFLLSGGVDSTAMLSLASRKTDRPISSYTVGFANSGVADERPFARLAAVKYGAEHHEISISSKEFADFLPKYVWHMEEPVCEPPAVALYYVSKLARNYVKVLISGEGGDEAFAGYPNYRAMLWIERIKRMAGPFTGAISGTLSLLYRLSGNWRFGHYQQLLNAPFESYYYSRSSSPFRFFNAHSQDFYCSDFGASTNKQYSLQPVTQLLEQSRSDDVLSRMLYVDTRTWLPDDLLVKADKMTMANSVELRVPLLDHKLLEFAATLPSNFKINGFSMKYVAKRCLTKQIPREILERKKAGFPVPYENWLRTDMRDSISNILLDRETTERGYFKKSAVEKLIRDNSESGGYAKEIFSLVVLELWHREFLRSGNSPSMPIPLTSGLPENILAPS